MKSKYNTPPEIFVQENDNSMMYGINQDTIVEGMVKYVREDFVPNDNEMLEFADKMTFHLDDRLCPYSRDELRARAFLEGMYFAKHNIEERVVEKPVIFEGSDLSDSMTVSEFCKRFSQNNEVYVENRNRLMMQFRYQKDGEYKDAYLMDWELKFTDISDCRIIKISNVIRPRGYQGITFVIDTDKTELKFVPDKISIVNAPLWLYEEVCKKKIDAVGESEIK